MGEPVAWLVRWVGFVALADHTTFYYVVLVLLVLVMFWRDKGKPSPIMAPFAHIGIEVPEREDVVAIADRARAAGCLTWEPTDMPDPIGFICAITDPDGNVIEISHNQGVFAKVQEVWGGVPISKEGLPALARQSMALPDFKNNPRVPTPDEMLKILADSY